MYYCITNVIFFFCGYFEWIGAVCTRLCAIMSIFSVEIVAVFACMYLSISIYVIIINVLFFCVCFVVHSSWFWIYLFEIEICAGCLCFCVNRIWLPVIKWEYFFIVVVVIAVVEIQFVMCVRQSRRRRRCFFSCVSFISLSYLLCHFLLLGISICNWYRHLSLYSTQIPFVFRSFFLSFECFLNGFCCCVIARHMSLGELKALEFRTASVHYNYNYNVDMKCSKHQVLKWKRLLFRGVNRTEFGPNVRIKVGSAICMCIENIQMSGWMRYQAV